MSSGIKSLYEKRLLLRALSRLLHGRWACHASINGFGDLELRKYGALSAVTSALSEGSTPGENAAPTISTISLDPNYYGEQI